MDADHLDIYGDSAAIEASFREFADKITDKSKLFVPFGMNLEGVQIEICDNNTDKALLKLPPSGVRGFNIRIENTSYVFDVQTPTETIKDLRFNLPGKHNLMNALMALAMAKTFGIPNEDIARAMHSFNGIKRRFSYQIKTENLVYIDDYAHHPTEINAVNQAVRELYPNDEVLAIFQPHLFSRTKDFADDFAKSLSQFDQIILLDIYPARELPMEGITSEWLMNKMTNKNVKLVQKQDLIKEILGANKKIIVTIGAGDIGEMVNDIKDSLVKLEN